MGAWISIAATNAAHGRSLAHVRYLMSMKRASKTSIQKVKSDFNLFERLGNQSVASMSEKKGSHKKMDDSGPGCRDVLLLNGLTQYSRDSLGAKIFIYSDYFLIGFCTH